MLSWMMCGSDSGVVDHYNDVLDGETAVVVVIDQIDSFYQYADGKMQETRPVCASAVWLPLT